MNISSGPINIGAYNRLLGIDESGKGDFFGPLVIAGVLADRKEAEELIQKGVRDSKKISDNKILDLSRWIKDKFTSTVVIIGPEKYNQLYARIRNLNKLLAWGHSRVIENLAAEHEIDLAVSDKFGNTDFIEPALMKYGIAIRFYQQVGAESIPQVAAASILARAAFVRFMKKLENTFQVSLPKGAGSIVDQAASVIVRDKGREVLDKVAKIHFKNYRKVTGQKF